MADQSISFKGAAVESDLENFWPGGSKKPAIQQLLNNTIKSERGKFCNIIQTIVEKAIVYRSSKNDPITIDEIKQLNALILKLDFKIPELWDPKFLDSLPRSQNHEDSEPEKKSINFEPLKQELIELSELDSYRRGYGFEKFLNKIFSEFNMKPKGSFRITGEQIDGSFDLDSHTYLIEAKWQNASTSQSDLLILRGKVEGKATWSRGLFISYSGFTKDGIEAFSKGKQTNMIGMTGQDLFLAFEYKIPLDKIIQAKARIAAETGDFYISAQEFLNQGLV